MKAVLRRMIRRVERAPRCQILERARRIVRDHQPDKPSRMWFKPYYGIEAERVGRDRGLCASAILSPEAYHPGRCRSRMVGSFAEFERAMLRERTKIGLETACREGRIGGRPPKLKAQQTTEIIRMI